MNGTAPDLDDDLEDEGEPESRGPMAQATLSRYESATSRVLQWEPAVGGKMLTGDEFRWACNAVCQCRQKSAIRGCFKWLAIRMGMHRHSLRRIIEGVHPLETIHILALKSIILTDWMRSEGHEPKDIYNPTTTSVFVGLLREKAKGYVPPEEKPAEMTADQLQARWFQLANDFSDVKWPPDEDDVRKFEFAKIADLLVNQIIFSGDNKVDASRFGKRTDELIARMDKKRQWREDAELANNG